MRSTLSEKDFGLHNTHAVGKFLKAGYVKLARDLQGTTETAGTCRMILTRGRFSQLWPALLLLDFTPDKTGQI